MKDLPPSYDVVFAEAAAESFYLTKEWFDVLAATTSDDGDRLRLYGVEEKTGPAQAILIARASGRGLGARAGGAILAMRTLAGFSNFYSPTFAVVARPDADRGAVAAAMATALAGERPRWDAVHLQALDPQGPSFAALTAGLRGAGMVVQRYVGFGNWFEPTAGASFQEYFAGRPAALVNTVRRKEKKLAKMPGVRFSLITDPAEAEAGAAAYERVYASSWKEPEPYPRFMPALIRTAATMGALRLGVIWIGEEPVAAQTWITWRSRSTIFKLAHDRRFDSLSVGSVLTMWMMRHALDIDRVAEVDFGVGDDPYKRIWLAQRRERRGILALNPRTPRGLIGVVRHVVGRAAKRGLLHRPHDS